ncbi:MAG: hypothetical protein FWD05_04420 [Oscillospiraceae bacterium]|nr:hypothetical protein [Oscillospiraceae bacterium]
MSGTHNIDHDIVDEKVAQLTSELLNDFSTANSEYNRALSTIDALDSATHASLVEATKSNRRKAAVTSQVLINLLDFVRDASNYYRQRDELQAALFPPADNSIHLGGGNSAMIPKMK